MANILASAIISKARIVLQDTSAVRWVDTELLGWLNDAQRAICAVLPEINSVVANIALVLGTKQALPSGGVTLLKLIRNMGVGGSTPGVAIRKVGEETLNSQVPDWHTQTATAVIKHYTFDFRATRVFYVYPPSVASNQVEALYTVAPADIILSASITIDDIYANMMLDYVLYRAYSKDMELIGNAERATAALDAFTKMLSAKKSVDATLQPADQTKG